jgi:hypothetical protein
MIFDWPYYYLRDGWLVDGTGRRCPQQSGPFPPDFTVQEAEQWLVEHDIRGTVIE